MSISTSVTSDKPSKLLGLYLWMKLTNPRYTIALAYIWKQFKKAIIAAEKDKKNNNFFERFIKQEEEYDLIMDEILKNEMKEMELKKAKEKDKKDESLMLIIHSMFENACKAAGVLYVNPVPIYESMNARELQSSPGFAPENVVQMPEFKQIENFFKEAQQQFKTEIEKLNGSDWKTKMAPVISQLKENMDKVIGGTFSAPNNDSIFVNADAKKNIANTLQNLEAQYKENLAKDGKLDIESSPIVKVGKMLEGHYTPERLKEIEQKAIKEKGKPEDVVTPKSVNEGIKVFEEKIKKQYVSPTPKPKLP